MSALDARTGPDDGGPPRRPVAVGLLAALVVGLAVTAIWLLQGHHGAADADTTSTVAASPLEVVHAPDAEPAFPASPEDSPPGAPAAAPAPVEAMPKVHRSSTAGWREVRGIAVRVSDGSPVDSATIMALFPEDGTGDEPVQTRTDRAGTFTLSVPREAGFQALLPTSGNSPGESPPDSRVETRVEWANDDPNGNDVRLVLDTGWALDVYVIDGESRPHAGVLVRGGGRSARTDASGRCALLDIPFDVEPFKVTVQAPGAKALSYTVDAPQDRSLRKEVTLKAP